MISHLYCEWYSNKFEKESNKNNLKLPKLPFFYEMPMLTQNTFPLVPVFRGKKGGRSLGGGKSTHILERSVNSTPLACPFKT